MDPNDKAKTGDPVRIKKQNPGFSVDRTRESKRLVDSAE